MKMPEPFDIDLAVARLDKDSTKNLRDKYPRLTFVWDELDDLRADADDDEELTALEKKYDNLVEKLGEVKELADSIAEMENLEPIKTLVEQIGELYDDA